jgi:hypothetical protein
MPIENKTVIAVSRATRERLKKQGAKGETYDELINQLIDCREGVKRDEVMG